MRVLVGDAHQESGDVGLHVAQMKTRATCCACTLVIIAASTRLSFAWPMTGCT
jgi:hypothetical protein